MIVQFLDSHWYSLWRNACSLWIQITCCVFKLESFCQRSSTPTQEQQLPMITGNIDSKSSCWKNDISEWKVFSRLQLWLGNIKKSQLRSVLEIWSKQNFHPWNYEEISPLHQSISIEWVWILSIVYFPQSKWVKSGLGGVNSNISNVDF